jgi:coproporphyrinogen III oxidase-like Fe-S oxidoreductase
VFLRRTGWEFPRRRISSGTPWVPEPFIYGTLGESDDQLLRSFDAAIAPGVEHISAYALVVEDSTALARRVLRGVIDAPDDDVLAHRWELLDARLSATGFDWYEVSD